MLMKSCFSSRETANCLIIQVFTLMKHYSMDLEHGVQPNYHPSTQAVKSDYSLASQWVVQTSFLFSDHQRRVTAFFSPTLPFKNMRVWTVINDRSLLKILRISMLYKEGSIFLQTVLFLYNLSSMFSSSWSPLSLSLTDNCGALNELRVDSSLPNWQELLKGKKSKWESSQCICLYHADLTEDGWLWK